jgi:AraC family transcriptional regulator of adaptative response/methylated-DNA-[protein]-cysteine methyltransferase
MNKVNGHSRRVTDYERIERAIRYLEENYRQQPDLKDLARGAGLSEFHFQRLFRRWAGISPKRFVQYLTAGHAVRLLRESRSNLDAAWEAGLSGGGRLHDLLVNFHAVTPGELKRAGAGLTIQYGFHPTPFGECLIAVTARGVCHLAYRGIAARDGPDCAPAVRARQRPFTGDRSARARDEFPDQGVGGAVAYSAGERGVI